VRLATFNIKHAELRGVPALAEVLRWAQADLIGLQEVDVGCERSGGADQAAELGAALGMASSFAPAMQIGAGAYGNALLAREDLLDEPLVAQATPLPGGTGAGEEPRVLLLARAAGLRVYVAHLDLPGEVREAQAEALLLGIGDPRGAVILGDLNEGPDGPAVSRLLAAGFRDAWAECGADEAITAPSDRPQARIDQVLLGPDLPRARRALALATDASDHAVVVVEL
jgi:endonuclease/exonuclease/phosphatase family metal-dependent hydrolase